MLDEGIRYLYEGDEPVVTVLIGGVLSLLSIFIIPYFIVVGYLLVVLDRSAAGVDDPPLFEDWGELLVEGFKGFIITFVYGIVPSILGILVVGVGILGIAAGGGSRVIGALGIVIGMGVWLVLSLIVAYIIPAALANFVEEGRIGAGFAFGPLRDILLTRTYAIGWLTAAGVVIIGWVVSGLVGIVPIVGWLAGPFILFYFQVGATFVIGRTWADVRASGATA